MLLTTAAKEIMGFILVVVAIVAVAVAVAVAAIVAVAGGSWRRISSSFIVVASDIIVLLIRFLGSCSHLRIVT